MSARKLEPGILNYFRTGEPAAVKLLFSLVKAAMRERFGSTKTVTAKRPRKTKVTKAAPETGAGAAA
jgi:hypothetical protein